MMMKQGKLRFLSARILCVIIGLIVVIGILSLLLLFDSFKESSVNVVILAFCIGLTLLLCCFFWKMIVKPFNQMEKNLGLFLDGYTTSHLMGEDNIFYISPAYEGVITKIQYMLQSQELLNLNKRQAQYLALQNQINPHFLYNTMDMINWLAQQGRTDEVSRAVQSLSRFYKLTLSRKQSISTIYREAEHVSIYLQIQNMRYHDSITFVSDIPDELMEYQIPKLTLQPIIENSVLHGILETADKTGTIVLTGWMEDSDIVLLISDDGIGIAAEQLATILSGEGASSSGGTNIAVYNTHRRLQILYGSDYGLSYTSNPGQGTEVEIRIPARKHSATLDSIPPLYRK